MSARLNTLPGAGKGNGADAVAAARTALAPEAEVLAVAEEDWVCSASPVLLVARRARGRARDGHGTGDRNLPAVVLRSIDSGIGAGKPLTEARVRAVARWQPRHGDGTAARKPRTEARRIAVSVLGLTRQMEDNPAALTGHVSELVPGCWTSRAPGPAVQRSCLPLIPAQGQMPFRGGFRCPCRYVPLPASSGNTVLRRSAAPPRRRPAAQPCAPDYRPHTH